MEQNEWSVPLGHVPDPVPGTRLTLPRCPTAYHSAGAILTLIVPDWVSLVKFEYEGPSRKYTVAILELVAAGRCPRHPVTGQWSDSALLLRPHPHAIKSRRRSL
jgi:hypothetical protein